jgi:cobalamin synthase
MSQMKAIKTFRDLLTFLTIIPFLISVFLGVFMERVAKNVFGGVSGDMIGATNKIVRAITLVSMAGVWML